MSIKLNLKFRQRSGEQIICFFIFLSNSYFKRVFRGVVSPVEDDRESLLYFSIHTKGASRRNETPLSIFSGFF